MTVALKQKSILQALRKHACAVEGRTLPSGAVARADPLRSLETASSSRRRDLHANRTSKKKYPQDLGPKQRKALLKRRRDALLG